MTKTGSLIAVACAALILSAASAAHAQDPSPPSETEVAMDQIAPMLGQLLEKLRPLAEAAGVAMPELIDDIGPMMRAAFPTPAEDIESWAFGLDFENTDSVTDNGSAPEGREPILEDAQACAARYPEEGSVVHFRRIRRDGMTGHQCVLRRYDGDMGTLISQSYAEGVDRHMVATYKAAASTNDPEDTRALMEPAVEANVALAITLADLSLDALIRKEVQAD